jgi:hypothetical protein
MELWELAAREAIRETIASYAHLVDGGRFDEVVQLFAPDGVLEVKGRAPAVGHDALRALFTGFGADLAATTVSRIRHYTSNLTIDVAGHDEASARCYFLALTETGVDHWGRYRDRLVPADDGCWRFAHRYVRTDGTVAGGWAESRI